MTFERNSAGVELIDLLDRVLDKGIVVEASSRLHLAGMSLLRTRGHIVVESVDTHLGHTGPRAVMRLDSKTPRLARKTLTLSRT